MQMNRFNRGRKATETKTPDDTQLISEMVPTSESHFSRGGRLATLLATGTAVAFSMGIGSSAEAQASPNKYQPARDAIAQKYNEFLSINAIGMQPELGLSFIKPTEDMIDNLYASSECDTVSSFRDVTFRRIGKRSVQVSLTRAARVAYDPVIQSPEGKVTSFGVDCGEISSKSIAAQIWYVPKKVDKKGRRSWKRVPGTTSKNFDKFNPDTQNSLVPYTGQPNLKHKDTVTIKLPKNNTDPKNTKYYATIIDRNESLLGSGITKNFRVLAPPISKSKKSIKVHANKIGSPNVLYYSSLKGFPKD